MLVGVECKSERKGFRTRERTMAVVTRPDPAGFPRPTVVFVPGVSVSLDLHQDHIAVNLHGISLEWFGRPEQIPKL